MVKIETQWFGYQGEEQRQTTVELSNAAASIYSYEMLDGAYALGTRREIHVLNDVSSVICTYDHDGEIWRATTFTVQPA